MNRTISTERTFQYVQFEPLKFTDTITDIPEDIALNEDAMSLLRRMQLLEVERAYILYCQLRKEEPDKLTEAKEFIDEVRILTYNALLETFKKGE